MRQIFIAVVAVGFCLGAMGVAFEVQASHGKAKVGIKIIKIGDGPAIARHSKVSVNYTGWLGECTQFDSSFDRGTPFNFTLGTGSVIRGWDIGIEGMKLGETREVIIPPALRGRSSPFLGRSLPWAARDPEIRHLRGRFPPSGFVFQEFCKNTRFHDVLV